MRRANRPIALVLLLMAVLCSPAGVCVVDGMAATAPAATTPAHAHGCGKAAPGTFIAPVDASCCSVSRTGFVTVVRFTLEKHAAALVLDFDLIPAAATRLVTSRAVERRTPLVLRI